MNIFVLDRDPIRSAEAQHDRHVVKMILESTQILSTVCQVDDFWRMMYDSAVKRGTGDQSLYKPTHQNHPVVKWATHQGSFVWLTCHLAGLINEYNHRFPGRNHKCKRLLWLFARIASQQVDAKGFFTNHDSNRQRIAVNPLVIQYADQHHERFTYCGPIDYNLGTTSDDLVIESYRRYYIAEKCEGNRWTNPTQFPDWLAPHATLHIPPRDSKPAPTPRKRADPQTFDSASFSTPDRVRMPSFLLNR